MTEFFAQGAAGANSMLSTLLMFGAMFAIVYFILIRPQQKQQKKHQALLAGIKKGDEVILSSGIIGKIYAVEERLVVLEIGEKTKLKVLKQAVTGLVGPNEGETGTTSKKEIGPAA